MKKMMRITFTFFLFYILLSSLFADTNFRVMTYNALYFPSQNGAGRLNDFGTIFTETQPDILLMQEMESESGVDMILNELNSNGSVYSRANFVNGFDMDNILYYKNSIATLISQNEIETPRREISEYIMQIDGNEIRFYSCHLKASEGEENEDKRLEEVTILRAHLNALTAGTEFIIVGDMNIYTSSESAYQKFIADETDNDGRAEDLCDQIGNWHNSATYVSVHTQSTRTGAFGGGAGGGLDDRFDMIFTSYNLDNSEGIEYVANSLTPFGNDGNHFNDSINDGYNSAVSAEIADALYNASDHLPVYADFISISGGSPTLTISDIQQNSSEYEGQNVELTGIVTGTFSTGYFIQDGVGAWNGIYIYDSSNNPNIGDEITVLGEVAEYYDKTELKTITQYVVNSSGNELPNAVTITTYQVNQEMYEGVLVKVENAECTNTNLGYGEWEIDDDSGSCRIDDLMFAFSPTLGTNYDVTGIVDYSFDNFKVEPKNADDISESVINPQIPQNIQINVTGTSVTISWNSVENATSYKVYSDTNPNGDFTNLEAEVTAETSWTDSASYEKKFYRVAAVN